MEYQTYNLSIVTKSPSNVHYPMTAKLINFTFNYRVINKYPIDKRKVGKNVEFYLKVHTSTNQNAIIDTINRPPRLNPLRTQLRCLRPQTLP